MTITYGSHQSLLMQTDPAGHNLSGTPSSAAACGAGVTEVGALNALQTYCQLFTSINWACADDANCNNINTSSTQYAQDGLVASVQYNNNQGYQFLYNSYGDVAEIVLPTGGAYRYFYTTVLEPVVNTTGTSTGYIIERVLNEKDVYTNASDTGPSQVIKYSPLTDPSSGNLAEAGQVQYYDGSGNFLGEEDHYSVGINLAPPIDGTAYKGWNEGKEYKVNYLDTNGAQLRSEASAWHEMGSTNNVEDCMAVPNSPLWWQNPSYNTSLNGSAPICPEYNPRVTSKAVTIGSVTSQDNYAYDQYNNQIEDDEYDFTGSLIRATVTNYQYDTAAPVYILDLPSVKQVCNVIGSPAGTLCSPSNVVSQTNYTYDGTTPLAPPVYSSIASHDSTVYGTANTPDRGNATAVTQTVIDPVHGNSTLTSYYTYDIAGNITATQDPRCVEHIYGYVDAGNTYAFPTSVTSYTSLCAQGGATLTASATYDYNIGKAISTTDVNGETTHYYYSDLLNRLTSVRRPDGGSTTITYNDTPSAVSVTSSEAQSSGSPIVATTLYDGLGRKSSSALSEGSGYSIVTAYGYDGRGRQNCASLPLSVTATFPCSSSSGTTTVYDGITRPTSVTEADGSTTRTAYVNNQTFVQDPAGFVRLSVVDAAGRLISVQENPTSSLPSGITSSSGSTIAYTTSYTYDPLDDLTSVTQTDPNGAGTLQRTFVYDSVKRLVQATNPENGKLTYSYDSSSNLATRTDAVRTVTYSPTIGYDGMNRITGKSYSDGLTPLVTYAYCDAAGTCTGDCNELGRLTSVSTGATAGTSATSTAPATPAAPATSNTYSCFDSMGRVANSSQQIGAAAPYSFSYTYDISGALANTTYPSLRKLTNTFDAAGRIGTVSGTLPSGAQTTYASGPVTTGTCPYTNLGQICYAPQGAVQSLALYNGVYEAWNFNALQQPNSLTATLAGAAPLMSLAWTYNTGADNGNVMGQTISRSSGLAATLTQSYSYADPANRLSSASEAGGWAQTYNYDAFGNRAVAAGSYLPNAGFTPTVGGSVSANQFPNNQWIRGTPGTCTNPGSGDRYDCAGNQTALAMASSPYDTSGSWFAYDGENRLLGASVANQGGAGFVYDGEGRRVQKISSSGAVATYVYDAMGNLAAEYSTAAPAAAGTQYLTSDFLGSTRLITDASGNPVRCIDYLPFGEEIPAGVDGRSGCYETMGSPQYPSPPDVADQKFTGKERDTETGLDYFEARYMSSAQGRFTSPDPVFASAAHLTDPQMWNEYAYVRNNPLRLTDPTGLDFYTTCTHTTDNGDTCQQVQNGSAKVWVQGTTDSGGFTANRIANDENGNLVDVAHGNAAVEGTFDQNGVHFNGSTTANGQFIEGSDQTNISGSGLFAGIEGQFVSACGGSCQARGALNELAPGALATMESGLNRQGGLMSAIDLLSGAHNQGAQWKDASGYLHVILNGSGTRNAGITEMHFEGHPTGVDVVNFVLHMVDTIRDAVSGRAATEKNRDLP